MAQLLSFPKRTGQYRAAAAEAAPVAADWSNSVAPIITAGVEILGLDDVELASRLATMRDADSLGLIGELLAELQNTSSALETVCRALSMTKVRLVAGLAGLSSQATYGGSDA